ncbi:MAG: hypothetical protein GC192_05250 [Bacteroidetes bacterium]|nr:hypothetical protein [Bacteroidota bacterium]
MNFNFRIILSLFFLCTILHLIAIGFRLELLTFITKPLLVSLLSLWYYSSVNIYSNTYSRFFLFGLILSVIGDSFLMFVASKGELFFLLGLGSFLLAHLCYISTFSNFPNVKSGCIRQQKALILPFLVVLISIVCLLWNGLGKLLIPVVIYSTAIIVMCASSFNMKNRVPKPSFQRLFSGAILFVISDLIIALKKFKYPEINETFSSLAVMTTYLLGQFLLTSGMIKIESKENQVRLGSSKIMGSPK